MKMPDYFFEKRYTSLHILLIDDHILFRQGLKFLLSDLQEDVEFYEANSVNEALQLQHLDEIQLVLLDLYMPGENALYTLDVIKSRCSAPVVVLSSEDNPQIIRSAIDTGASGFVPKSSTQNVLIAALRLILAGGTYLPPNTLYDISVDRPVSAEVAPHQVKERDIVKGLSDRQYETLLKAVQGKSNKIIAREMCISVATVKAHLSLAFKALGVENRTEAVYMSAKLGLTPIENIRHQPALVK